VVGGGFGAFQMGEVDLGAVVLQIGRDRSGRSSPRAGADLHRL